MNFGSLPVRTETFNMTYIPQQNKLLKIFEQNKKTSCKTNYPCKAPSLKASQILPYQS